MSTEYLSAYDPILLVQLSQLVDWALKIFALLNRRSIVRGEVQ
jgi:hypothetical protein